MFQLRDGAVMLASHEQLFRIARAAIERNIVRLPSGAGLTAGQGQFEAFWTRDYCFAARALLHLGHGEVVRDHLSRLLSLRRKRDGLVPRLVDSVSPGWLRVLHFTGGKMSTLRLWRLALRDPLHPEYRNEHGVASIDSNVLTLLTAIRYVDHSSDEAWWRDNEPALISVFRYYERKLDDGLIVQPAYSDWQDSVRRRGKVLFTNLLYCLAGQRLVGRAGFGMSAARLAELRRRILETFYDARTGLLRSRHAAEHVSLDDNLLALEDRAFFDGRAGQPSPRDVYRALRRHPLWPSAPAVPGFVTYPDYAARSVALQARLVGLRHYHDKLYWSWLMALAAKVARQQGDEPEARRIFDRIERMVERDRVIHEVYEPRLPHLPVSTWLYTSESSFSWGAGMIIDALRS